MRTIPAGLCALIALVSCGVTQGETPRVSLHIESQPIPLALKDLGEQTGLQIMFRAEDLAGDGLTAPRIAGELSAQEALEKMLVNTGLQYRFVNPNTVLVSVKEGGGAETAALGSQMGGVRLAQADTSSAGAGSPDSKHGAGGEQDVASPEEHSDAKLEEIVVTAQKRVERLQDVPVPVTVINTWSLVSSGQLRLQDYYAKVPGLNLAVITDGQPTVTIRGLATGGITNTTAGIVVDDVPYGATISPGVNPSAPDIDPGDLARIEVLRGPQGTLYGASSIGGLLKYVTVDPSTDAVSGSIQAGLASVHEGEVGHTLRAALNLPLGDTFAIRASGFTTRDPGYVDNIQTGEDDVNRRESEGGRLSALWRISQDFSLKVSAALQQSDRLGTEAVDTLLGDGLEQRALRGTGHYDRHTEAYSAILSGRLGDVEMTSLTGYNVDTRETVSDLSASLGTTVGNAIPGSDDNGVNNPLRRRTEKFTQELRATIPIAQRIDWLLGAFYTDENVDIHLDYLAANPASGAIAGTALTIDQPTTFEEYAAFTTFTFKLTERFDVQLGGRLSENRQSFSTLRSGPLVGLFFQGVTFVPEVNFEDDAFTYLVTPRFRVSPDLMLYARVASGYRPGGPNSNCGGNISIPCQFDADTTDNYEIGVKGTLFDRALSFDASVYYIDWEDAQFSLLLTGLAYTDNVGQAKSQGMELAVEAKPFRGFTISTWAAWNDAELKEGFVRNVVGRPGDRLPYSGHFSGSLSVNQDFPLWGAATGFVGASASYVDDRRGIFRSATQVRETFPSYTQVDLRTGVRYDTWTLNVFVNNLGDERGILRSGLDAQRPTFRSYIQPRTIGASLTKTF